jgi:hypothetical protein
MTISSTQPVELNPLSFLKKEEIGGTLKEQNFA